MIGIDVYLHAVKDCGHVFSTRVEAVVGTPDENLDDETVIPDAVLSLMLLAIAPFSWCMIWPVTRMNTVTIASMPMVFSVPTRRIVLEVTS